jgi:RND family efflux transporter MFP subunit
MNNKLLGALAAVSLLVAGCGKSDAPPAAPAAGGPVSVGTVRAEQRDVEVTLDATGTVASLNSVEVRPQVAAVVEKVHVREGQFVRAGEPLFTLDSRAVQTDVAKAQAQLQRDLASLADAERNLARSKELFAQNFVSRVAVDTNQTLVDAQRAAVAADRAAIEAARVNLSYTRIAAPYAGRAGLVPVAPGSFVSPNATAPLVTITQLDPIAVAFSLPQRNLSDALQTLRSGGGRVTAVLPEGRGTLHGKLHFVDNVVDASSGAVKVKALFDNPDGGADAQGRDRGAPGRHRAGRARQGRVRRRRRQQGRVAAGRRGAAARPGSGGHRRAGRRAHHRGRPAERAAGPGRRRARVGRRERSGPGPPQRVVAGNGNLAMTRSRAHGRPNCADKRLS